ncbi:hypothetical protein F5Y06DRAFT_300012 [Hypoxylon sp. FL0890]|nr:hypothetical protein F5Y06DRAFT_300012 [Hypoxylon sp. FL0890]
MGRTGAAITIPGSYSDSCASIATPTCTEGQGGHELYLPANGTESLQWLTPSLLRTATSASWTQQNKKWKAATPHFDTTALAFSLPLSHLNTLRRYPPIFIINGVGWTFATCLAILSVLLNSVRSCVGNEAS